MEGRLTWQRLLAEPQMMKGLVGRESLIWIVLEQLSEKAVSVVTFKMPVLGPPVLRAIAGFHRVLGKYESVTESNRSREKGYLRIHGL
jgi:hypothetical protein